MPRNLDYKSSGVNIELGDDASRVLYEAAKLTWNNRKGRLGEVVEIFPDFSGLRAIHVGGLPDDAYMNLGFDGVGTKIEIGERLGRHETVAYDLFAMVCDDVVVRGAEPVIVGSLLDVRSLGEDGGSYLDFVKQLAIGYVNAARDANVAVVNGDIAELGARVSGYGPFNYNWGAGVVWFARKGRMFTGKEIKEGDSLVGLREDGARSNGLSMIRRIMLEEYGDDWHEAEYDGMNLAEVILEPSRIYSGAVVDMFGGFDDEPRTEVHGVAHITGGGLPGKLGRVLRPSGFGADVDDPFEPPRLMLYCQETGGVTDREAYKTWSMGQGMVVITPKHDEVIQIAKEDEIDAKVIGEVSTQPGVRIRNRGLNYGSESELVFNE